MNDENLENFKKIDEDELFNNINEEFNKKINEIEKLIKTTKKMAEINIKKSRNEDEFRKNVEENDELFDDLIEELNDLCNEYKNYLKQKNNYIILGILKLKEYQKKKEEFDKKMRDFRNATMSNYVSTNSNKYIELESHWYWFFGLYKNLIKKSQLVIIKMKSMIF